MWRIIKYYYYYIYFNAYWSSFDIGESTVPRQNAGFYMSLLEIFFVGGVSFTLSAFGININLNVVIFSGVATVLLLNYFTLSKEIFDNKYGEYEFLSRVSKKRRLWLFFSVVVGTGLINITGAFLFAL